MTQEGYALSGRGKRLGPAKLLNLRGISAEEIMYEYSSPRSLIRIINLDFPMRVHQLIWWRD
jgi:hypothetical protein